MRLSKPLAVLVGVLTIWPTVYVGLFMGFIFWTIATQPSSDPEAAMPFEFLVLLAGHAATMVITVGLLVFYIVHVFKNPALTDQRRTLWAVVLFMGSFMAMPIYWFLFVWRQATAPPA
jgi:hypothetical protein